MTGGIPIQCTAPSSELTPPHSEPDHTLLAHSTTDHSNPLEPNTVENTQEAAAKLSSSIPITLEQQQRSLHEFGLNVIEGTPYNKVNK